VLLTPLLFNPNFGGVPVAPDRRCWASASTWTLSYLAVKLFSKNSNLCDHGTWSLRTDRRTDRQTDGQTDGRLTVASPRSALASRGKKGYSSIQVKQSSIKILVLVGGWELHESCKENGQVRFYIIVKHHWVDAEIMFNLKPTLCTPLIEYRHYFNIFRGPIQQIYQPHHTVTMLRNSTCI